MKYIIALLLMVIPAMGATDSILVQHPTTATAAATLSSPSLTQLGNAGQFALLPNNNVFVGNNTYSGAFIATSTVSLKGYVVDSFAASLMTATNGANMRSLIGAYGSGDSPTFGTLTASTAIITNATVSGTVALPEESRVLQVIPVAGGGLTGSGSITLADISGGPGNMDSLQIAIATANSALVETAKIRITIDGTAITDVPYGLLFLTANTSTISPSITWMVDNIGVTRNDSTGNGAQRRIFIPFNSTLKVELINTTATDSLCWTQVEYRLGAIPWNVYGHLKKNYHHYVFPAQQCNSTTSVTLLPTITASGVLDSIQLTTIGDGTAPGWLEGDPLISRDGGSYTYGGTEDFFGVQWYGLSCVGKTTNQWGVIANNVMPSTKWIWNAYRFWGHDNQPFPFHTSLSATWLAGATVTASALIIYYTEN